MASPPRTHRSAFICRALRFLPGPRQLSRNLFNLSTLPFFRSREFSLLLDSETLQMPLGELERDVNQKVDLVFAFSNKPSEQKSLLRSMADQKTDWDVTFESPSVKAERSPASRSKISFRVPAPNTRGTALSSFSCRYSHNSLSIGCTCVDESLRAVCRQLPARSWYHHLHFIFYCD